MPAQAFGKGHAQGRARLPVRGIRRQDMVDGLDRQCEILDPGREYIAKHAPRFIDVELSGSLLLLHQGFLARLAVRVAV